MEKKEKIRAKALIIALTVAATLIVAAVDGLLILKAIKMPLNDSIRYAVRIWTNS